MNVLIFNLLKMIGTSISMENSDLLLNPSISICRTTWMKPPTTERTPNLTDLVVKVWAPSGPNNTRQLVDIQSNSSLFHSFYALYPHQNHPGDEWNDDVSITTVGQAVRSMMLYIINLFFI